MTRLTRPSRPARIAHWLRAHPLAADALGAVCWALFFAFSYAGTGITGSPGLLFTYDEPMPQLAWSVLLLVPTALRRWRPRTAVLLFAALVVLHLVFGPTLVLTDLLAPTMLYAAIVYGETRDTVPVIVLAFALAVVAAAVITWASDAGPVFDPLVRVSDLPSLTAEDGSYTIDDCSLVYPTHRFTATCATYVCVGTIGMFLAIAVCLTSAVIVAFWQRARLVTIRMMQERNAAIEAGEAEERHIAALAERARIARDMHDVVAHTLSIIIVQSDGGRYAGAHDPAVARSTMETIRHESERALHDMKRLLGVFGGSVHADYADIDALVAQACAAADDGTVVRHVGGPSAPTPGRLSADAGTAAYHVVQEALTNVRKYAGPGVHVTIDETWTADALTIAVADDGRGASSTLDGHKPGYGLLGMRERLEAAGGTLEAGPRVGGGFAVRATLPLSDAGAASQAGPADQTAVAGIVGMTGIARTSDAVPGGTAVTTGTDGVTGGADEATGTTMTPGASISDDGTASSAIRRTTPPETGTTTTVPAATPTTTAIADVPTRAALPSTLPRIPSLSGIVARFRGRTVVQAVDDDQLNWIERMSRWTQRHYLLTDTMIALILIRMTIDPPLSILRWDEPTGRITALVDAIIVLTSTLPLAIRRRFPETAAATTVVCAVIQLLTMEPILFTNMFSLCVLYSAVMYGRERAWRWTGAASIAVSALLGVKVAASMAGHASIAHWLLGIADTTFATPMSPANAAFSGILWAGMTFAACLAAIAMARWSRSNGANVLVLQAREEALMAEQAKQRVLAANMERDRISANIQTEVSETLTRVIDQAATGIRMIDETLARGDTPSAQEIGDEFAAIGRQGRAALARMRELLGVLRATGFSDEAHASMQPDMQLRPAASLDEQLRNATR